MAITSHSVRIYELNYHYMSMCLVAQSCPNLYDSMDCSPRGSSVHGIL